MAEFNGVGKFWRQPFQKFLQSRQIRFEIRRQLPEQRPQFFLQRPDAPDEIADRAFQIVEPFDVRDVAAAFDRENKILRRLFAPVVNRFQIRQAIKRRVDLNGGKLRGVMSEMFTGFTSSFRRATMITSVMRLKLLGALKRWSSPILKSRNGWKKGRAENSCPEPRRRF
jgi:hypothetical protein